QMKKYIDELVDRRNSIVHELDFRPNSSNRNDLSKDFVSNALEIIQYFIESVNYQIVHSIISSPEDINFSTGNENFDDISNT
ncbi:MAG: HEPN domain-containing protein, partial [Peptostreptococcus porci]|nr:HEPN domain-containing protein [Peptostreptococcus porci]